MKPVDRLAKLARVAHLREDRAQRAWRAAVAVRQLRDAERAIADGARGRAIERLHAATANHTSNPGDPNALLWRRVTRDAADESARAAASAAQAVTLAQDDAEREARAFREREARRESADARVGAARRELRRAAETRADDDANDVRFGGSR